MLSLNDFLDRIIDMIQVDPDDHHDAGASLYADWAIDSLQAYQLVIAIEALADVDVPPDFVPELFTPADLYDYYQSLMTAPVQ